MAIAGMAALIANACGSDSASGESDGCEPQSTRECVGPAACKGGQACGADRKWSVCDCGTGSGGTGNGGTSGVGGGTGGAGSGGTSGVGGGSGGTGGSSASGGGGTSGDGGTSGGGTSGGGGTSDGGSTGGSGGIADAGDASADQNAADATDSGLGPNDDPCPTEPINVNCSTSCGSAGACKCAHYGGNGIDQNLASHYVARTPSNPDGGCGWSCPADAGQAPFFWMHFALLNVQGGYKLTVGKPWRVFASFYPDFCVTNKYANGCARLSTTGVQSIYFYVATDDPNAPARNILIEKGFQNYCTAGEYWQ